MTTDEVQVRSRNSLECCYLTEDRCKEEVITKVAFFSTFVFKNTCGQAKQPPIEFPDPTCTSLIIKHCFCNNGCNLNVEMYYVDFLKNMLPFS